MSLVGWAEVGDRPELGGQQKAPSPLTLPGVEGLARRGERTGGQCPGHDPSSRLFPVRWVSTFPSLLCPFSPTPGKDGILFLLLFCLGIVPENGPSLSSTVLSLQFPQAASNKADETPSAPAPYNLRASTVQQLCDQQMLQFPVARSSSEKVPELNHAEDINRCS